MTLGMTFGSFRLQRKFAFRYPVDPAPRTAVLAGCFRATGFLAKSPIRIFAQGWSEEVTVFAPGALAATREELMSLAGAQPPPVLTHAVIVLERPGQMLPAGDRERLWRAFRVPVFEQIIGPRGELLAAECEAHDGLHVEAPGMTWDGYRMESAPCGCGRATPRLVAHVAVERTRSVAAYAR